MARGFGELILKFRSGLTALASLVRDREGQCRPRRERSGGTTFFAVAPPASAQSGTVASWRCSLLPPVDSGVLAIDLDRRLLCARLHPSLADCRDNGAIAYS